MDHITIKRRFIENDRKIMVLDSYHPITRNVIESAAALTKVWTEADEYRLTINGCELRFTSAESADDILHQYRQYLKNRGARRLSPEMYQRYEYRVQAFQRAGWNLAERIQANKSLIDEALRIRDFKWATQLQEQILIYQKLIDLPF